MNKFREAEKNDNLDMGLLEKKEINGLTFYTERIDSENPLKVYPYHDEAKDILSISKSLNKKFDYAIDFFCGGGHSLLPIIKNNIARKGVGFDCNPRAIELANKNKSANKLLDRVEFKIHNVKEKIFPNTTSTLYIANPPFVINVNAFIKKKLNKKFPIKPLNIYRDGGTNGLEYTEIFLKKVKKVFKKGDTIIGLTYSRININRKSELEGLLQKTYKTGFDIQLKLLKDRKIWRGLNNHKNETNPMPIDSMILKADPYDAKEIEIYKMAINAMKKENWSEIGYFCYIIS